MPPDLSEVSESLQAAIERVLDLRRLEILVVIRATSNVGPLNDRLTPHRLLLRTHP
jgi:hypothetical protein